MKAALIGVMTPLMLIAPVPRFRNPTPPVANCAPVTPAADATALREVTNCPATAVDEPPMPCSWADCSGMTLVCAMAVASVRTNDTANKQKQFLLGELRLARDASARDFICPPCGWNGYVKLRFRLRAL